MDFCREAEKGQREERIKAAHLEKRLERNQIQLRYIYIRVRHFFVENSILVGMRIRWIFLLKKFINFTLYKTIHLINSIR